jgi:hypothetical protein
MYRKEILKQTIFVQFLFVPSVHTLNSFLHYRWVHTVLALPSLYRRSLLTKARIRLIHDPFYTSSTVFEAIRKAHISLLRTIKRVMRKIL